MVRPVSERPGDRRIDGPGGRAVLVEWFRLGRGLFGIDRRVGQDAATHARVSELDRGGAVVAQRVVAVTGVDDAVAVLSERWVTDAVPDARPAQPPVESFCARCGVLRTARGRRGLVERIGLAPNLAIDARRTTFDVYACPTCGSCELFLVD